ncbi:MAG: hypothetical protein SCH39_04935 [Methanosarcinales archaeon]|nr:hypothetical protein [ANME-2 cluster archaeon]MDF1531911.1 hypothetical protein [ANME-2 cluster archaeon]MDW7775671.1 hypothetical protein [Methanosarcinales archaeon]
MSEQEPQDTSEWEAFADKKFDDIKKTIKDIETKGSSQTLEQNVRDAAKGFGDMLISLSALAYGVSTEVAQKASPEKTAEFQKDIAKKARAARNAIADELEKVSRNLRAEEKGETGEKKSEPKQSDEPADIT